MKNWSCFFRLYSGKNVFFILSLSLPFHAFERHRVIRFHKSAPGLYKFKNDQTIKLAHSQLMFSTDLENSVEPWPVTICFINKSFTIIDILIIRYMLITICFINQFYQFINYKMHANHETVFFWRSKTKCQSVHDFNIVYLKKKITFFVMPENLTPIYLVNYNSHE